MIVRFDGAMGTELQVRGLKPGEAPENWNLIHPDAIESVHRAYLEAGAEIIVTNTFGANPAKYDGQMPLKEVIEAGVGIARAAGAPRVALDIGPTGRLLRPSGDFSFTAAYDAFAEAVVCGANAGADLILLETFADTYELKAAILAARENSSLPVFASVALDASGKLLTGADVDTIAALFSALKPDAVGFNCGLGPDRLLPFVKRLAARTNLPILVKPNAGLPRVENGRTVFDIGPDEFARAVQSCVNAGATYIGGCCGTTPDHIRALGELIQTTDDDRRRLAITPPTVVSSYSKTVELTLDDSIVIGERINPTGKPKLREAYKAGDRDYILREALAQVDADADVLDVNAGVPGIDEPKVLAETIEAIQSVTATPLQIDTADPIALERALRLYNGKALINSVNAKESVMSAVFPLVAKYGGVLVALTLDENGIPPTAAGRLALARKMLSRGAEYGLTPDDFVIDVLCLAVSAEPTSAPVILESLRRIRAELGVRTVLGVSNISYGLPSRPVLNATFYALALEAGLTCAIINPLSSEMMGAYRAWRALTGRDQGCLDWIGGAATVDAASGLGDAVGRGLKGDAARAAETLLAGGKTPLEVIDGEIIPALEAVGRGFESGKVFLPQLLMSADAASAAFAVIQSALTKSGSTAAKKGPIILATVQGDIHDIGKNIVRALLENYGFEVVDLGRDVAPETILTEVRARHARLVGLSALMTTTLGAMKRTIEVLREEDPSVETIVGGAVLTEAYAHEIGATWYAKDAMATVRIAQHVFATT